jgi:hypothetical protein
VKESAALVLLPVSACNVVVAVKPPLVGVEELDFDEFPQAAGKMVDPSRRTRLKTRQNRPDFTGNSVAATEKTTGIPTAGWFFGSGGDLTQVRIYVKFKRL